MAAGTVSGMRLYLLLIMLGMTGTASHLVYAGLNTHALLVALCGLSVSAALAFFRPDKRPTTWAEYGYNCKPSKCCEGELLVPLHSTNTKICTGCKLEHPWPLEAGQKRTFD